MADSGQASKAHCNAGNNVGGNGILNRRNILLAGSALVTAAATISQRALI